VEEDPKVSARSRAIRRNEGKQFTGSGLKITGRDLNNFWGQDEDYARMNPKKAKFLEDHTKVGKWFDWKEADAADRYARSYAEEHGYSFVYQAASEGEDAYCILFSHVRIPGADKRLWMNNGKVVINW